MGAQILWRCFAGSALARQRGGIQLCLYSTPWHACHFRRFIYKFSQQGLNPVLIDEFIAVAFHAARLELLE